MSNYPSATDVRRGLRERYPDAFNAGARRGFAMKLSDDTEPGGYPKGFHVWSPDRRNAYFAGWNLGNFKRVAAKSGGAK